jgi:hypothetical protein
MVQNTFSSLNLFTMIKLLLQKIVIKANIQTNARLKLLLNKDV